MRKNLKTIEREMVREKLADAETIRRYYREKYPNCDDPRHPGCVKCGKGMPEEQRKQAGKVTKA